MPLASKEIVSHIINYYHLIYAKEMVALLDISHTILYVSPKNCELVNTSPAQMTGKNIFEILPLSEESRAEIASSIRKVVHSKVTQEYISINLAHADEYRVLHCIQKPVIHPVTQDVIAISIESKKLNTEVYLYKLLQAIEEKNVHHNEIRHKDILLTLREHEISFLLIYYKTAKKIAMILSKIHNHVITPKTVSNIISGNLYRKLSVYGIDQLIEKIIFLGYHKKIPVSLLVNMHVCLS